MRSSRWGLNLVEWVTLRQEEETTELSFAFSTGEQEDMVRGDHLQGSEFLTRSQICWYLDHGLLADKTVGK